MSLLKDMHSSHKSIWHCIYTCWGRQQGWMFLHPLQRLLPLELTICLMECDKLLSLDLCSRSLHGKAAALCCWQQRTGEHGNFCMGSQGLWSLFPPRLTCCVFSLFPRLSSCITVSHPFSSFLLRCLCPYVSWLPVLVFVSWTFTDFHLPNLF